MRTLDDDGPLGLIVSMLDDLFGGRARVHLVDRATNELASLDDEPTLVSPGPLHDALETSETVVVHVASAVPSAWSASYGSWIPRGGCRLVARRIEGGGDVVGVLSVLRSDRTRVPTVEDVDLIGALAARIGRTSSVALARSSDVRVSDPPAGQSPVEVFAGVTEAHSIETAPMTPWPVSNSERATFADAELTVRAVRTALDLGDESIEVTLSHHGPGQCAAERAALASVLSPLSASLGANLPARGVIAEMTMRADSWITSIRPRHLEDGWPVRPTVPDDVVQAAHQVGGVAEIVATPDIGWLIEVTTPAMTADSSPTTAGDVSEHGSAPDIDLMAASLGDTAHMVMVAVDSAGRVTFCNDELAARLGGSVADLIGRPLSSARGSSGSWGAFQALFARADEHGMSQGVLSWPHPDSMGHEIRWTLTRSHLPDEEAVYVAFGVDMAADVRTDG